MLMKSPSLPDGRNAESTAKGRVELLAEAWHTPPSAPEEEPDVPPLDEPPDELLDEVPEELPDELLDEVPEEPPDELLDEVPEELPDELLLEALVPVPLLLVDEVLLFEPDDDPEEEPEDALSTLESCPPSSVIGTPVMSPIPTRDAHALAPRLTTASSRPWYRTALHEARIRNLPQEQFPPDRGPRSE
jgi:hypothetical protein